MESIVYKPIGYVKSPYTSREDMPRFYTDSGEVTAKLLPRLLRLLSLAIIFITNIAIFGIAMYILSS